MSRTTDEDLSWARSGTKKFHIVRWTPYSVIPEPYGGGRLVKTKKRGHELMQLWRRWYQRKGWIVYGNAQSGFRAYDPSDPIVGVTTRAHHCRLLSYDPKTDC